MRRQISNTGFLMRQLLYISETTRTMSDADLRELLEVSWEKNLQHQITGLLLYAGDHFVQVIEGDEEEIRQLTCNIRADQRNSDFTMMFDRSIDCRAFAAWTMGFRAIKLDDFRNIDGFKNLGSLADLDSLESGDDWLFDFMRKIYLNNVGLIPAN
ncbi:MAG: BLUF domain-containing protein [Rhodospirillaceae bacterium]|nr:BLUF domain-containing protein [Rhodospirillaceae bacterium]MBT6608935.1 BLUF domain-containing protein [Rhodospirillaceae bacterium]MBT6883284.1 BLUF domain-containing protein [Rhodospirillaceae bacterium]MBT7511421.1 BLUF domain-containing protein [Rhodospirillaceae bacterium]